MSTPVVVVDFPDGSCYDLVTPLVPFRHCHDGTPAEARMVFSCVQTQPCEMAAPMREFIMKIKVQVPTNGDEPNQVPEPGPSSTTAAELKALQIFCDADVPYAPHLVQFKQCLQGSHGPLPGGYLTYTVMTKVPGDSLHNLYFWGMSEDEREKIMRQFLIALRSIYVVGVEPVDCALRNVLWESATERCTIIDFELWRPTTESFNDESMELQRWGLARQPAAKTWWDAWNTQWR